MPTGVTLHVDDPIAVITIDRPETRNAIDRGTMTDLARALDTVEGHIDRHEVRVVAVRGGGDRVFISGGDLKELATIRTEPDAQLMSRTMRACLDRLATLAVPTVALINGHAFGGGAEVAIACDIRIAAEDVRIAFNQVALGIMPAWGGVERLTTFVGRGRAMHMLLTGAVLTAREAGALGLVETVAPRDGFDDACRALLGQLASVASVPGRAIKALVGSIAPPSAPEYEAFATSEFARSWTADAHWSAVEAARAARTAARVSGGE